ncbi:MAG TPA: hypothetical protein PLL06_18660 [Acidobacteriota bacterium]|nr:hypothetical protein [Acidobacteriota bacterium]
MSYHREKGGSPDPSRVARWSGGRPKAANRTAIRTATLRGAKPKTWTYKDDRSQELIF